MHRRASAVHDEGGPDHRLQLRTWQSPCARALHTGSWNAHSASGFRVFATSRNIVDLQDLKLEGVDALQLDVTDAQSVKSAVDHIVKEAGGIDLLVCNAGIHRIGPIIEQDLSEVKAVVDTNVYGTSLCARAVAPVMMRQRSGIIAAVGSISASITAPYCGIYSASKAATRSMIEAMRLELSPYSVKATFIEAGIFCSSIIQKYLCYQPVHSRKVLVEPWCYRNTSCRTVH